MQPYLEGLRYIFDGSNWDPSESQSISTLLLAHLFQTGLTLLISLAIAVPLSLLIVRYTRLDLPVQTVAGIAYTIPSFAFLAVMIGITGLNLPTLIIPLIAYAQIVLIRNIVAGIRSVDPALVEVGQAMGMNGFQVQTRVVLPLALPVIVAGIRITAVTTIGIATLGPLVTVDNLGTLIISDGVYLAQTQRLVAGSILVVALAIGVDLALLGLERALRRGAAASGG